jgi:hypothetical protein
VNWLPLIPFAVQLAKFAMEQAMKRHPQGLTREERQLRAADAIAEIMRPR